VYTGTQYVYIANDPVTSKHIYPWTDLGVWDFPEIIEVGGTQLVDGGQVTRHVHHRIVMDFYAVRHTLKQHGQVDHSMGVMVCEDKINLRTRQTNQSHY